MKAVVSKWKDFSNQVNQDSSKASIVTIMSKDGKFLLVKRGMTAHWEPGKWGLVGGFIHKGEDPHDGAVREVFEDRALCGHCDRNRRRQIRILARFKLFALLADR